MEHHLGLTCDPIGGLVQIPLYRTQYDGRYKAIHAAELALESDPNMPKSHWIRWSTPCGKPLRTHNKYKETSEGGLAVAVNMSDC
jgi:L-serine dehydratase